ncbi:MAG: geranylgeranyl reductase family protein [Aquificae bacterium]|nr:geranylgeranyl reductase family protein [Aquificota bacterium]
MERYDAVVVGGGPAGSTAAAVLASRGLKVLLLERRKLPRFKLCGGALSSRITPLLPEGYEREILNVIKGGILGFRGEEFTEKSAGIVAYIIERSSFDYFLVEEALERGAHLLQETALTGIEEEGPLYRLITTRGEFLSEFVVGADGFYSRVASFLGMAPRTYYRSLELEAEGEIPEERVIIDLGVVKRGYAWIFPKGDRLNIGIATTGRENLYELLVNYVKKHKLLKLKRAGKPRGWFIPFRESANPENLGRDRILLCGDAGSFVDPLLGEGIYYAVLSGKALAESIIASPSRPLELYAEKVKPLLEEFGYAGKIARLAYRFQRVAFSMGGGYSFYNYMELLKGKQTYRDLYLKGWKDFILHFLKREILGRLKLLS